MLKLECHNKTAPSDYAKEKNAIIMLLSISKETKKHYALYIYMIYIYICIYNIYIIMLFSCQKKVLKRCFS